MSVREAILLALGSLWANRLRTFLTVIGNVVAVLSVVMVVSVLRGFDKMIATEVISTGADVFTLTKFGMIMDYETWIKAAARKDLTAADAKDLGRRLSLAEAVVPRIDRRLPVRRGGLSAPNVPVSGVGAGYPLMSDLPLAAGRHLDEGDVEGAAPVAVIGDGIREKLFAGEDPLGAELRVGGRRLRVVGVVARRGGGMSQTRDDLLIVPITTCRHALGARGSVDILVKAASLARLEEAKDEAILQLKIRRGLKPWQSPDFDVTTDQQFYDLYENFSRGIYGLLVGVVGLSLLVGGIVIMNVMLVAVTERTREIGVRKAIGARRSDIVRQFLIEAVTLAAAGGVLGVSAGVAGALAIRAAWKIPASVEPWSVVVGLVLASSVGLFFGIYPAFRASSLPPIEALRAEN